jgi:hypothetical protein
MIHQLLIRFRYGGNQLISLALLFSRIFLYGYLLQVNEFADLARALLISSTFGLLDSLGSQQLVQRVLPGLFAGQRDREGVFLILQTVLVTIVLAVSLLTVAIVFGLLFGTPIWWIVVGLLHGCMNQIFLLASMESKSRLETMRYSKQLLARSGVLVGAGVGAIWAAQGWILVLIAECRNRVTASCAKSQRFSCAAFSPRISQPASS